MITTCQLSKETLGFVSKWVSEHPNGGSFASLEKCFEPLLQYITTKQVWAVTGIKTGESKHFIPRINNKLINKNPQVETLSKLIRELGDSGDINTTTDFCLPLHQEKSSLFIWANDNDETGNKGDNSFWNICVSKFVDSVIANHDEIKKLVLSINDDSSFDRLKEMISLYPNANITYREGANVDHDLSILIHGKQFEFKLYITIITLMEPNWRRIAMVPSITPIGHYHHPGGLVICEGNSQDHLLSISELNTLSDIASIPFWPWMLTARITDRGFGQFMPMTIGKHLFSASNDYRNLEYLFGGKRYTLTDNMEGYNESYSYNRIVGIKELCNFAECILEDNKRYENLNPIPKPIITCDVERKNFVDINEEVKAELLSYLANLAQKVNVYFPKTARKRLVSERIIERGRKKGNIAVKSYTKISIVVPLAPDKDRVENFINCLRSYDSQSAIRDFPEKFELIILIDTSAASDLDINTVSRIKDTIRILKHLPKIDIKIYVSKDNDPIGRSSIRNFGVLKATGNVIQFFDDSILLHKDYLMEVLLRFEYLTGQKFVLVGFKERLSGERGIIPMVTELLGNGLFIPDHKDDFKKRERSHTPFSHAFKHYKKGEIVDYMEITSDLCFLSGNMRLGHRSLNTFFSTAMVAVWKDEFIQSGGFDPLFNYGWGLEDGQLGSVLLARGNKIIPCYSALAIDLQHTKAGEKSDFNRGKKIDNQEVENALNKNPLSYFNESRFFRDTNLTKKKFTLEHEHPKKPKQIDQTSSLPS